MYLTCHLDLFDFDMLFSPSPTTTTLTSTPSIFARLERTIKSRMSIVISGVPRLFTVKGRNASLNQQTPFIVRPKHKSSLPLLQLSQPPPPTPSSSFQSFVELTSTSTPTNSEMSISSVSDINLSPSSSTCIPVLLVPPAVGTKITDRFWPEEDFEHKRAELPQSGELEIANVLSPPPYHRRSPSAAVPQNDILSSDKYCPHHRGQDNSFPLRFPF